MIIFSIIYVFIVMSLWAYLSRFFDANTLLYKFGFTCYATFQWLLIFDLSVIRVKVAKQD
jgi:hypothetical protein